MAAAWIKMRVDLTEDPAIIEMAETLSLDEFAVVGRVHRLWGWADAQSRDGHAKGVTGRWIDRYVQCDGFAESMVKAGWLVLTEDGIELPNFDRHNGETAKKRGMATNRQAKHRAGVTPNINDSSRIERDKDVTREEKRREEQELKSSLRSDSSTASPPSGEKGALAQHAKSERLAAVTDDAIAAFNLTMARPQGLLAAVTNVGIENKRKWVKRCIPVARQICGQQYGSELVTPQFWADYFGACQQDDFKSGRQPGSRGHASWTPTFEYLTRPQVMTEVFDSAATEATA